MRNRETWNCNRLLTIHAIPEMLNPRVLFFLLAQTDSKEVAEKVEAELMAVFDYAWNQREDFYGRSRDILAKIVMGPPRAHGLMHYLGYGSRWNRLLYRKKGVDISIAVTKPAETWWEQFHNSSKMQSKVGDFLVTLKKLSYLMPYLLVQKSAKKSQFTNLDIPVERCGAALETGQQCSAFPVRGQKHCLMHKDVKKASKKASEKQPTSQANRIMQNLRPSQKDSRQPHRAGSTHLSLRMLVSCFPFLAAANMQPPKDQQETPKRRGSLSFNTWLQTSQTQRPKSKEWMAAMEEMHSGVAAIEGRPPASLIGGQLPDQLSGGKKSMSHNRALSACIESQNESCKSSGRQGICGLKLDDNTVCTATSQPNRRRCFTHQGLRSPKTALWSPEAEIWSPGNQSFSLQFSLQT